jgi:hypothetical protein
LVFEGAAIQAEAMVAQVLGRKPVLLDAKSPYTLEA